MPTREEVIAEARRIFAARGIDPDVALRVLQQESGLNPAARNINPKEESYGLAQLNVKGGLGAEARKRGIEPSDPNQWQRHLEFMADTVKRDGWRQWYGARDAGIGRYQGVRGAAPTATALGPKVLPTEVTGIPAPAAAPASPQTVANIQELQKQLLARYPELRVTSGYRDPAHNAAVGGAKNSQHTHGRAIDVSLRGIDEARQREIVDYARQLGARGLGYYPNSQSAHFDVRPGTPVAWGQNTRSSSLPGTPRWFQDIAAQHMKGGAPVAPALPSAYAAADPNAIPTLPANPARGILADNPMQPVVDAAKERQEAQTQQMEAMQASLTPQPAAPAPPPPPQQPIAPTPETIGLLLPRLRRGLLASSDYGMLGVG